MRRIACQNTRIPYPKTPNPRPSQEVRYYLYTGCPDATSCVIKMAAVSLTVCSLLEKTFCL